MGILLNLFFKIVILIILRVINNGCDGKNYSFKFCESIRDCSDSNQICLNKECKCGPNYKFNLLLKICVNFKCVNDLDCQQFDKNQVCNNSCNCYKCDKKYIRNVSTNLCSVIRETNSYLRKFIVENEKISFIGSFGSNPSGINHLKNCCIFESCNSSCDCENCGFGPINVASRIKALRITIIAIRCVIVNTSHKNSYFSEEDSSESIVETD